MGAYINPDTVCMSIEDWLEMNAKTILDQAPTWEEVPDVHFPVCMHIDRDFTVARIAYSRKELAFLASLDGVQKNTWYIVSHENIKRDDVSPELEIRLKVG